MGRNSASGRGRGRKNKARMNYLKDVKRQGGGGGGGGQGQEGATSGGGGYKTGDYVSAYGYHSRGRGRGGGRGGGGGRKPRSPLTAGMKGFLLTTNFRESDCVREAYNLLNEYDDGDKQGEGDGPGNEGGEQMEASTVTAEQNVDKGKGDVIEEVAEAAAGSDKVLEDSKPDVKEDTNDDDEEDIAEALQKEMKTLKSDRVKKKFNCVDSGVKNVVFVNTTVEDPTDIVYRIFDDVLEKHEAKSRHILRFMPIEATCKMDLETIKEVSKKIFPKYFKDGYKSFKIVVNVRYNSSVSRDEIIKTVAEAVDAVNPLNFVDLKNATYTIVAEVLKGVVCLGVLKDFTKYKKFNIAEAAAPDKPLPADETPNTEEPEPVKTSENEDIAITE